jgi:hypothetical protein
MWICSDYPVDWSLSFVWGRSANEGRHPVIYGLTDVALLDIFY